jgi:hypothetical protein
LCHSLCHAGLLVIEGDPVRGLTFRPAAMSVTSALRQELEAVSALPVVRTVQAAPARSGCLELRAGLEGVQAALEKVGFSRQEARRRVEIVAGGHRGATLPEPGELVKEALRL